MTDREQLIELHEEAGVEWDYYVDECINEGKVPSKTYDEFHADHLLANGVIVLPCKVGDMVYMVTTNGNIRNLTILGIDIELDKKEDKMTCLAIYEFEGNPCYIQIQSYKFGETVFLTKEEAKKALAERSADID